MFIHHLLNEAPWSSAKSSNMSLGNENVDNDKDEEDEDDNELTIVSLSRRQSIMMSELKLAAYDDKVQPVDRGIPFHTMCPIVSSTCWTKLIE